MRVINKKMVVVVLLIIEFICGYLMYQSSKKEVDLAKVTYEEEISNNMFAMYVENEDTGEYEEVTNTNTFPEGYILNMDKTGCIDNKGNSISDILTSKDDKVIVKSNKTVFCYLYFDKDNRVYTQVKRDYKNSSGALLLSETESDEYPVYYYSGDITNNNILYANFCWKMVRTTETGGVKLIYNGVQKLEPEIVSIDKDKYAVSVNTPSGAPFTFDDSTKQWINGTTGVNSSTNTIEFTVTEDGNYVLNYLIDSEPGYDKTSFYKNETALKSNISGIRMTGVIELNGLTTDDVIKVVYTKDASSNGNTSDTVKFSIGRLTGENNLTCNNSGEESQIGTSAFNSPANSLAYAGYMYNDIYLGKENDYLSQVNVYASRRFVGDIYCGDIATWNGTEYELSNSDGSEVTTYTLADSYTNLAGMYTCVSSTSNKCTNVSYIISASSNYIVVYELSQGKSKDDYKIKLATSVTDNGDGTYTLVDPVEVTKADWHNVHSNYKNYYYCSDLISDTCGANDTIMYYSTSASSESLTGINISNVYKYGNSFTYENGTYKLVDTKEFWDWSTNYNQISNNHYTCFNTTGECEEVKYIFSSSRQYAYYITLKDGEMVEDAINEMLYADDVNKTDSTIKAYIDEWYEVAILNKTDENGALRSNYLENTIFCNNRTTGNLSASGWNSNGGSTSTNLNFNNSSLECANKTDQFTLKVEAGGIDGYGNNALDYPIGLISYKEASLATTSGYLKSGNNYWVLSPWEILSGRATGFYISYAGSWYQGAYLMSFTYGVRPSVSLSNKVEITEGDGSVTTPYQVELSS